MYQLVNLKIELSSMYSNPLGTVDIRSAKVVKPQPADLSKGLQNTRGPCSVVQ